jgi:hypothetical protein
MAGVFSLYRDETLGGICSHGEGAEAQLLKTWVVCSGSGRCRTDKIDRVTSQPSEMLKLSIDDLEDRATMLQDLGARISFLKGDLGTLLVFVA